MTYQELKDFCNNLPEAELNKKVILWRENDAITNIMAEQLTEDHYIDVDNTEDGCFPESELKSFYHDMETKKVYDKGTPILHEIF